ncbi:DNA-binding transcriptional regulator LsrR (DeoR family) [Georgenia soli]|uniref:DNA-binding transcriptional regulator LsrR (DeoR family) n=1 Tax=Georgenia soli TaxID=638953 RepID=A0A2A9F358_9MICO|nr:sugar-binding domain-containing protein [Georgenia soli]PFG44885.1 DNA-binding transcriptional regulator LsrR (DeoR family) [Georgenia soli]
MEHLDQLRMMTKVARLYHTRGMRQTEIGERLRISQSRVSRLLQQAEDAGIVRTVVSVPQGLHAELEEAVELEYGVAEVHVVDAVANDEVELARDLGHATAFLLSELTTAAPVIAFTSWSQTLRQAVDALQVLHSDTGYVVETLGDLGPPLLQHEAARSTQRLASLSGGRPVFLRTPGVVASPQIREALLAQDPYARQALEMLDDVDIALVGIGSVDVAPWLKAGDNYFTERQLANIRAQGAVGEVCLRFIDEDGNHIASDLDDLVIGISPDQLKRARRRWAVAGGERKLDAIKAALRGGWVDVFVTDAQTAERIAKRA